MKILKDEYNIDCFMIKVNKLSENDKDWGVKTIEYLANNYNEEFYMLRSKGIFGLIVHKENCTIL